MFCSKCGKKNKDSQKFCTSCGFGGSNLASERVEGEKDTGRKKVVIGIALLASIPIIGIISGVILVTLNTAREKAADSSHVAPSSNVEVLVYETKSTTDLPQRLDDNTIWIDVTAESGAIRYHYTMYDLDVSGLADNDFKEILTPKICGNNNTKSVLDEGIPMEFVYTDEDSQKVFFVRLTGKDCLN